MRAGHSESGVGRIELEGPIGGSVSKPLQGLRAFARSVLPSRAINLIISVG